MSCVSAIWPKLDARGGVKEMWGSSTEAILGKYVILNMCVVVGCSCWEED